MTNKTVQNIFDYMRYNYVSIQKDGKEHFHMPIGLAIVLFLLGMEIVLPIMIVGLFFDLQYVFSGANNMDSLNTIMDGIYRVVQSIKDAF